MENKIAFCKHNPMIDCAEQNKCYKCGWNPAVAAKRVREWKQEQRIKHMNRADIEELNRRERMMTVRFV